MSYSLQSRDRIFEKGYGFLSFAKNIGKPERKIQPKTSSLC